MSVDLVQAIFLNFFYDIFYVLSDLIIMHSFNINFSYYLFSWSEQLEKQMQFQQGECFLLEIHMHAKKIKKIGVSFVHWFNMAI